MQVTRAPLALSSALLLSTWTGASHGDEATCAPRPEVRVVVEGARGQEISRELTEQIFAELSAHTGGDCTSPRGKAEVHVAWPDAQHGHVNVALELQGRTLDGARDVDLSRVPKDTVPLALAIAVDELILALHEREESAAIPVPATAPKPASPPPTTERDNLAPLPARGAASIGPAFAYFSRPGATFLGTSLDVCLRLHPWVTVSLRGELDAPLTSGQASRSIAAPGARAAFGPPMRGLASVRGFAQVDLLLSLRSQDVSVGVEPKLGARLDLHLANPTRFFAEAAVGVVAGASATLAAGLGFSASSGLSFDF